MVYLPSELWLQILSYNETPRDLWRSLRRTNRQLRDCVEQHFKDSVIPTIRPELSFGLPCYDGRNPLRGKAIFAFSHLELCPENGDAERVVCSLVDVEPEHYMEQLLVRWDRLKESSKGCLPESLEWSMSLASTNGSDDGGGASKGPLRLKEPEAFSNSETRVDGGGGAGNGVAFEWKGSLTSFFL